MSFGAPSFGAQLYTELKWYDIQNGNIEDDCDCAFTPENFIIIHSLTNTWNGFGSLTKMIGFEYCQRGPQFTGKCPFSQTPSWSCVFGGYFSIPRRYSSHRRALLFSLCVSCRRHWPRVHTWLATQAARISGCMTGVKTTAEWLPGTLFICAAGESARDGSTATAGGLLRCPLTWAQTHNVSRDIFSRDFLMYIHHHFIGEEKKNGRNRTYTYYTVTMNGNSFV